MSIPNITFSPKVVQFIQISLYIVFILYSFSFFHEVLPRIKYR